MIETCLKYRDAFSHLSRIDKYFLNYPSEEEWERVDKIASVLKPFYDITKLFSGTNYPTANLYFHCVWKIQLHIQVFWSFFGFGEYFGHSLGSG